MANKYRGEVEFQDSDGKSYVLRLGTNQYITIQKALEKLDGVEWQRCILRAALINGAETQKDLTLEEVGDLIDDLGVSRVDELIQQTRWGVMSTEALEKRKAKLDEEAKKKAAEGNGNPPTAATS